MPRLSRQKSYQAAWYPGVRILHASVATKLCKTISCTLCILFYLPPRVFGVREPETANSKGLDEFSQNLLKKYKSRRDRETRASNAAIDEILKRIFAWHRSDL